MLTLEDVAGGYLCPQICSLLLSYHWVLGDTRLLCLDFIYDALESRFGWNVSRVIAYNFCQNLLPWTSLLPVGENRAANWPGPVGL